MSAPYRSPDEKVLPRGLPEHLPEGERLLWQGSPAFWNLACRAFHVQKIAAYFALLLAWRVGGALADGVALGAALQGAIPLTVLAVLALSVVASIAWLSARTTVYTITSRRLVLRCGIALPMTVNIPFRMIVAAGLKLAGGGFGDIAVTLPDGQRIAYLNLWPHVRAWRFSKPEPALRSLPNAAVPGEILARALVAAVGGKTATPVAAQPAGRETALPSGARATA
jgi:hypothetical protein